MIQIELVGYDHILSEIDLQVTKYVNKNLQDIIRVLIDMLENDPEYGLEDFFPRDYLTRKPEECRNTINELYNSWLFNRTNVCKELPEMIEKGLYSW